MAANSLREEYVVGVDLGGTKILAGVFDPHLKCIGRSKVSTKAYRGSEAVLGRIARAVREAVDESNLSIEQIRSIGIGAPGAVDPESGNVLFAPNLDWRHIPMRKALEKELKVPVFAGNDGNLCALGVYVVELGGKPDSMLGLFLGTGIGAGIIVGGKLHTGFHGMAAEIGHMTLSVGGPKCSCGNQGCFEALAGRQALFRKIQSAVKEGQKTLLTEMLGPELVDMRSGDLRKAIRRGDKFVERIVQEAAEYTGIAVANLINIFNPEVVMLGGGLIDALEDEMMAIIMATAHDYVFPGMDKGVEIAASKLGDDAGIVGAAVLARGESR